MKKILILVLAGVFLTGFFLVLSATAKKDNAPIGTEIGNTATDFSLKDVNEKIHDLKDVKGKKAILIVFWATWCPYCVNEIPDLIKIQQKYDTKDLEVWAVNIRESKEKVVSFSKKRAINYTVLLDSSGLVANAYKISGIPANIVIDKKGIIRSTGQLPNNYEEFFDGLIKESAAKK